MDIGERRPRTYNERGDFLEAHAEKLERAKLVIKHEGEKSRLNHKELVTL